MTASQFRDGKQLNKHSFTLRTHVDKKSVIENDEFWKKLTEVKYTKKD